MRRPYAPNNFCPCGSGKKYKKCCQPIGVEYFVRANGTVVREEAMDPHHRAIFEAEKRAFIERNNRQPTEEEENVMRIAETFGDLNVVIEQNLISQGVAPEVLYAFRRTGMLVVPESKTQVSTEELQEWDAAINEYRQLSNGPD